MIFGMSEGKSSIEAAIQQAFAIEDKAERQAELDKLAEYAKAHRIKTQYNQILAKVTSEHKAKIRQEKAEENRNKRLQLAEERQNNTIQFTDAPIQGLRCGSWEVTYAGVFLWQEGRGDQIPVKVPICPAPIMPTERIIDEPDEREALTNETLTIACFIDGSWKNTTIQRGSISTQKGIMELAHRAIPVTMQNARHLSSFITDLLVMNEDRIPRIIGVRHMGWLSDDEFMPYSYNTEKWRFIDEFDNKSIYNACKPAVGGSSVEWVKGLQDAYKSIFPLRMLCDAVIASFLLEKLNAQPFIIHLWGGTGVGKSVSMQIAASIIADPREYVKSMNATNNALCARAGTLRNMPLIIDEFQTASEKDRLDTNAFIMRLAQGTGRMRLDSNSKAIPTQQWRNVTILNGEQPICNDNSGGGSINRVIEIEVSETLFGGHDIGSLLECAYGNYGHMVKDFLAYLRDCYTPSLLTSKYERFKADIRTTKPDVEGKQAAAGAAILLADKLLCETIKTGIEPLKADQIADFLADHSDVDISVRAFREIAQLVQRYPQKFSGGNDEPETWGKILNSGTGEVWFMSAVLNEQLRKIGADPRACISAWKKNGKIARQNDDGRKQVRVSGTREWGYVLKIPVELLKSPGTSIN